MSPFLSDEEIAGLCDGLVMPAAQVRYLRDVLRLHVERKPSGKPLLLRSELERAHGSARLGTPVSQVATTGPNVAAFEQWAKQRKPSGQKSQGR